MSTSCSLLSPISDRKYNGMAVNEKYSSIILKRVSESQVPSEQIDLISGKDNRRYFSTEIHKKSAAILILFARLQ